MKQKTIVIIDDDADDLDIMREALQQVDSNLLCISFIYAEEALKLLSNDLIVLPDYIFVDINMPKITGDVCLTELRKVPELRKTPIVMYSTSLPKSQSQKFIERGATYTFQKPNSLADYLIILDNIISGNVTQRHLSLSR